MGKLLLKYLCILWFACLSIDTIAQYTFFNPAGSFAIEVSLPNTELDRLPIYRNSISSLAILGDNIVGGTSATEGLTPFIFVASLSNREVTSILELDKTINGQRSIATGFSRGTENSLYAGTLANLKLNNPNPGGHLIELKVSKDGSVFIEDRGVPVAGEGIVALTCNSKGTMLFGVTHPSGYFFQYEVRTGLTTRYKDIQPTDQDLKSIGEYALEPMDYLCKALVEDNQGMIYGSAPINRLFYFNPETESFTFLKDPIPEVWGRRTTGVVESWAKSSSGLLYGGNAGDGQLFILDPITKNIRNLGKPIMMNRIRGLAFAGKDKLYGIAGAPPGYVHLFSYDDSKGYLDMGNPEFEMKAPGIEQGINWRGFQLGTIAASEDGKYVVMGEDESLSQLMIFPVE